MKKQSIYSLGYFFGCFSIVFLEMASSWPARLILLFMWCGLGQFVLSLMEKINEKEIR